MTPTFKFIDLFAGIGGFRIAMQSIGGECVFSSEWDAVAASVYAANHGETPFGDITQIPNESIPAHDLICAGFPCQSFSIAGKRQGFLDTTKGTLFFEVARIADHAKPKALLLENVKNLKGHDGGKTLATITSTLDEIGYVVHQQILDSSDFGVPQCRKRIFIVAIRKDIYRGFEFPVPPKTMVSVRDILEENPKVLRLDDRPEHKITWRPAKKFSPNSIMLIGTIQDGRQGRRIYSIDGHSATLNSQGGGFGGKTGLYKVGDTIRKLSPRECARLQGFPEDFVLPNSNNRCYTLFGNSVTVPVVKAIGEKLLPYL